MMLPDGVSAADFRAALAEFAGVVGREWLFSSAEDVALYRDDYSPVKDQPAERIASAAVAPASTEEVQAVVRIANRYGVPLYPISTGRNLGYGGAAPAKTGTVVLDLKRMNRILAIDEARCFVLVEPGVSYFDLYRHIQDNKLKLWIDCPDPGWGSLIGNALDRGCGYTMPNLRNHWEARAGMEVVLASGELLRTGMGAMPGADTWQEYRNGYGPIVDGLFSQSNMGIVTKMGFWLMPEPQGYRSATIHVPRYKDLDTLVRLLNYVENVRLFTGMPYLSSPLLNSWMTPSSLGMEPGGSPAPQPTAEHLQLIAALKVGYSAALEAHGLAHRIPYWSLRLGFYGPAAVTGAQWAAIKALFAEIPDVRFEDGLRVDTPLTPATRDAVHHAEFGVPSLQIFQLVARNAANPAGSAGHLSFSPAIPRTAEALIAVNRVLGPILAEMQTGWSSGFLMPHLYWDRSFICVIGLLLSEDPAANARTLELYRRLVRTAAEHGWGEYRTPVLFQDFVASTYGFGDGAMMRFQEAIKDAVDPRGIIAPGRYGIWPQAGRAGNKRQALAFATGES
jgi:4-cresol dehydrogenase (hydroxylating)